jgi:uncharacterized membrane protein YbhN (UPF0104 family)
MNIKFDFGIRELVKAEFTTQAGLCNFVMLIIACFFFCKNQFIAIDKNQTIPKLIIVLIILFVAFLLCGCGIIIFEKIKKGK